MDTCEFDTLNIVPLQQKNELWNKVGLDILRLVSLLGLDKS